MLSLDSFTFWRSSKSLSERWRGADASQREALRLDLRRRFSGLAKDKNQKMRFGGAVLFLIDELSFEKRLEGFSKAFSRSLAALAAPENDWREADFERQLIDFFSRECWRIWAAALEPKRFVEVFRAADEADRERMRLFLAEKMEPIKERDFSAFWGGEKWKIGDLVPKTERDEPFSTALRQLFNYLEKKFEGRSSIETLFRKIFFARCVDVWRRKSTVKKNSPIVASVDPSDVEIARELSFDPETDRQNSQNLLEFERADLSGALRVWRREHFSCFFLIAAKTIRGLKAREIFESLQNLDDPSETIWQELALVPPASAAEIAQIRGLWNTHQVVGTMAGNCLLQFKNRFFGAKN